MRGEYRDMTYRQAVFVGFCQAVAALPGISRSGLTIAAGLTTCRLKRAEAANFSFLLSIPAIGGVVFVKLIQLYKAGSGEGFDIGQLVIGAVVSCVVGLIALRWLLRCLRGGRLHLFAWWCIPAGIGVTTWQVLR
jgi:undecaprenyl-diphosphatase